MTSGARPHPCMRGRGRWLYALGAVLIFAGVALLVWRGPHSALAQAGGALLVVAGLALQLVGVRRTPGARVVDRRYANEFFVAMAGYVLIVLLVWPQVNRSHWLWLKLIIAILPVVPTLFVARAVVRRIRGGDELERRTFLEAAAIAGLVVALVTFCAGFLQTARVLPTVPGELLLVLPLMCLAWGGALWWSRRRYR